MKVHVDIGRGLAKCPREGGGGGGEEQAKCCPHGY